MPQPRYKSLAATVLFHTEHWKRYEEYQDDIYQRVLDVHHTIAALECLADSAVQEFCSTAEVRFVELLARNFWNAAVVTLYGLVEAGNAKLSIKKFADLVLGLDWCEEQARQSYADAVAQGNFAGKSKDLKMRIGGFRNQVYAHRFIRQNSGEISEPKTELQLRELREVYDDVEQLFVACCVGQWFETTSFLFSPDGCKGRWDDPSAFTTVIQCLASRKDKEGE